MQFSGVQVLGKELRRDPDRALLELRARSAAASVCLRLGAQAVVSLEAPLRGQSLAGSQIVRFNLEQLGIPDERMILDTATRSTREEAVLGARIAQDRGWRRLLVITSRYHVPRARRCFEDLLGAGSVAVHAPEALLRHARPLERRWILEGQPDRETMMRECPVEAVWSMAARLLRPLPETVRWKAEVMAGAWLRGFDESALNLMNHLERATGGQ